MFAAHLNRHVVCMCFPNLEGDGASGADTLDCGVSEIAGVPLRKGQDWRSTGSETVFICFVYFGGWFGVFF